MKVFTVQTLENFMSLQNGLPEMDFFRGQLKENIQCLRVHALKMIRNFYF